MVDRYIKYNEIITSDYRWKIWKSLQKFSFVDIDSEQKLENLNSQIAIRDNNIFNEKNGEFVKQE